MSSIIQRIRGAALFSLAVAALPAFGQNGPASAAAGAANDASYSQLLDHARNSFTQGDQVGALNALFAGNTNRRNTAAWSIESGIKLLHVATSCVNQSDYKTGRTVAALAVQMFTTAEAQYVSNGNQTGAARADEMVGLVCEVVLHDDDSALAAYTAALNHDANSPAARNASNRLNHTKG